MTVGDAYMVGPETPTFWDFVMNDLESGRWEPVVFLIAIIVIPLFIFVGVPLIIFLEYRHHKKKG